MDEGKAFGFLIVGIIVVYSLVVFMGGFYMGEHVTLMVIREMDKRVVEMDEGEADRVWRERYNVAGTDQYVEVLHKEYVIEDSSMRVLYDSEYKRKGY